MRGGGQVSCVVRSLEKKKEWRKPGKGGEEEERKEGMTMAVDDGSEGSVVFGISGKRTKSKAKTARINGRKGPMSKIATQLYCTLALPGKIIDRRLTPDLGAAIAGEREDGANWRLDRRFGLTLGSDAYSEVRRAGRDPRGAIGAESGPTRYFYRV